MGQEKKRTQARKPCPEGNANVFSRLLFCWLNRMIFAGFKQPLERSDLWDLSNDNSASELVSKVKAEWQKEITKLGRNPTAVASKSDNEVTDPLCVKPDVKFSPKNTNPSLVGTLGRVFSRRCALGVFIRIAETLMLFIQPELLRRLIQYSEDKNSSDRVWVGYVYAVAMFVVALVHNLLLENFFHLMVTTGLRIRTALIGLLYEKSLVLSSTSRKVSTAGEIVTLMSVDTQRVTELMIDINHLWLAPVQIAVAVYFLHSAMGVAVFAGVALMLLLVPVSALVTRLSQKLQVKQMTEKGRRIRIINDVLGGIKVLKLYAWEQPFMDQIQSIRSKELSYLKRAAFLNAGFHFTFTCAPFLVSLATFSIYVLTGNELTAAKAFVAISLFNILRIPLGLLPMVITSTVQAYTSIKRISSFLLLEERDQSSVQTTSPPHDDSLAVCVQDGTFSWCKDEEPQLRNINLSISSGSLVAVVGQVGCGKTTLLSSLLGETEKLHGHVYMKGSVAYVPQQAWIQNATVRDNILFGEGFNERKYWKVVEACALKDDLDILPAGDATEIGEKGINLSGGQKQRISLARAVYFDADVYLLDDPLSAVDAYVGKHIFEEVFGGQGLLKTKTRILVTHGVGYLSKVNQVVVLEDGSVSEAGTYSELLAGQGAFSKFLTNFGTEHKEEDIPEDLSKIGVAKSLAGDVKLNATIHRSKDNGSSLSLDSVADREVPARVTIPGGNLRNSSSLSGSLGSLISGPLSMWSFETAAGIFSYAERCDNFGKIIDAESSETGGVNASVMLSYVKSAGVWLTLTMLLFFTLMEACVVGSGMWLARWSSANVTTTAERDTFLGVYGAIGLTQAVFVLLACMTLSLASVIASRMLHDSALVSIMKSPMSFFETTPLGRIVNRLSRDMYIIDELIPRMLSSFMIDIFEFVGIVVVISAVTPWFLSVVFPLAFLYLVIQRYYIAASRQLRRIESVSRSPIYNHFFESINGLSVIRAFAQQSRFIRDNSERVDGNNMALYPSLASQRWLSVRLSLVGNCFLFFAALLAVIGRDKLDSGLVGLSITFALQIIAKFSSIGRNGSMLETNLVSLERVLDYSETPNEAAWIEPDNRPPEDWPERGDIQFEDFDLKYRDELPLVLKNINCHVTPGQKVGIVGRTGAGKSTLTLALFRLLERDGGKLVVDGIDIFKIGLQDLRSKFAIIPQDPVLFSGTLRFNLDPFDRRSDQELWRVLELSHLQSFCAGLAEGLDHPIAEGGENLSVGQRQLVCLARALLRHSKILVLDEATAAVDLETDELIQQTIRREFADRTVLTIAHRLNTIMDYDRILVLDNGFVSEFDSPQNLLASEGLFHSMARDAGLV